MAKETQAVSEADAAQVPQEVSEATQGIPPVPEWMSLEQAGDVNTWVVDADKAYPSVLKAMGVEDPDRYDLQVAHQCIKLEVERRLEGTEFEGTPERSLRISIRGSKEQWAQDNYPQRGDRDPATATRNRVAQDQFRKVRGRF